jgi:outer membrane protein assembly factor BamB
MFKKSLAILMLFCTQNLIGCTKSKEDLASKDGQYFIKSLGDAIDGKDVKGNVPLRDITKSQSDYDHRNGSLDAKLSNLQKYNVNGGWNHDIVISSTPTFTQNAFILINDQGIINYIGSEDNSLKWSKKFFSKPTFCSNLASEINNNIIVASCGTNVLSAFDAINGKKLWSTELDMAVGSKPLIIDDSSVVVFSKNDAVYSLDLKSGELLWFIPSIANVENKNIAETKPILFNGQFVVQQTADDQVRLIDKYTGSIDWVGNISNTNRYVKGKDFVNTYGNIALDAKSMYLTNSDGCVVKMEVGKDKPEWIQAMVTSKPVWLLHDRVLGINDMGMIFALSKSDGKVLWSFKLNPVITSKSNRLFNSGNSYDEIYYSAPIVIDNKILILSSKNQLFLINPEDGEIIEQKNFNNNIFGQPIVYNGKIYVLINNGNAIVGL